MAKLLQILSGPLGPERARAVLAELSTGAVIPPDVSLGRAFRDLASGKLSREEFLRQFGHRGEQEMELSRPRWSEDLAGLDQLVKFHPRESTVSDPISRIAKEARLSPSQQAAFAEHVARWRTLLGLREAGKHYLMMGYAQIRRYLMELDRRHGLAGGVFFLTFEELPALIQGEDLAERIAARRRRRQIALTLEAPPVLFSDSLEEFGVAPEYKPGDRLQGTPLSAGIATAPALVLTQPQVDKAPSSPYILVCASTDPAWVPLFSGAKGLVMETGSVLSHGAIVAREFGLPAVAGIPGVHRRLRTGQRIQINGSAGEVKVLSS